jgi:hypothetical protein
MRVFFQLLVLSSLFVSCLLGNARAEEIVPRTIIALYDGADVQNSYIHTVAEMPLNHLGLTVEYHSIHETLPNLVDRPDVRGVITWFYGDVGLDAESYLKWAIAALEAGKKYVVIGSLGISEQKQYRDESALATRFLNMIGVQIVNRWVKYPFDATYQYNTPEMFLTRAPYDWTHPGYQIVRPTNDKMRVHVTARHAVAAQADDSALIVTGPAGGYMNVDYAIHANNHNKVEVTQWMIDPFLFFRLAFAADEVPKPDATTVDGRRIYYSNIDGDGWNNVTQLQEYRDKNTLSSEVILEKAIRPYPDLPVMIAPIAADVDPQWVGSETSRRIARDLWALPWVEAGSHTYSHPFDWGFFKLGDPNVEIPYLHTYTYKGSVWKPTDAATHKVPAVTLAEGFTVPRAFAVEPFNLHKEIEGSIDALNTLLPNGKRIEVLAWSGDCYPWEEAVHLTRVAKLQNINGGDTRFDPDYPAYASVAPIGRQVGKERQIYVSTSNENTYTDLWTENFHAFRYLRKTIDNSETPLRLKPFTIYYHMYSGEREASLSSLLSNLDYARTQDVIPLKVSEFTHIAEGFYGTRFVSLGRAMWRVEDRGSLQTIRFDRGSLQAVDFSKSQGVVGQRRFQGSLYVALDPSEKSPVIALKDDDRYYAQPEEKDFYVVESRWQISALTTSSDKAVFTAQGYGNGDMVWQVGTPGHYKVNVNGKLSDARAGDDRMLKLSLKESAVAPVGVTITKVNDAQN